MISVVFMEFRVLCLGSIYQVPDLGVMAPSYHLSRSQLWASQQPGRLSQDSLKEERRREGRIKGRKKEEFYVSSARVKGRCPPRCSKPFSSIVSEKRSGDVSMTVISETRMVNIE